MLANVVKRAQDFVVAAYDQNALIEYLAGHKLARFGQFTGMGREAPASIKNRAFLGLQNLRVVVIPRRQRERVFEFALGPFKCLVAHSVCSLAGHMDSTFICFKDN